MAAGKRGSPKAQAHGTIPTHAATEPIGVERKPRVSTSRLFVIALGIGSLSPCNHVGDLRSTKTGPADMASLPSVESRARVYGPQLPDDQERALEFMGQLSSDRWIHPLAGPVRRMPIRISRVFGAQRHGDRPGECRSGHCGVDIGGEMWGEPIMAVHEGVVDRVKRVDEGNGGMYVRISHREGKVFTQYFHLAAIPRDLSEGDHVRAGQVIGLLGDTGVKESNPHLHFTVSVKPTATSREIYMDPEPLIALWPLLVPKANGQAIAAWDPGVPLGAAGRPRRDSGVDPMPRKAERQKKQRRQRTSVRVDATAVSAVEDETGDANPAEDAYESLGQGSAGTVSGGESPQPGEEAPAAGAGFPVR